MKPINKCPIGKILNPLTNRCVKIDGKIGKEIIKNAKIQVKKEDKILFINKSIIDNIGKNDVILDPAGLGFMKHNFNGAGFASAAIYNLLSTSKPNDAVIKHFSQFKNNDYLYEKNRKKLSIAYYASYNNDEVKIIHAVGPDFRESNYLKKIIRSNDLTELHKLTYKMYKDIYKIFIHNLKKNNNLQLRLLPLSSGTFINFNEEYKIKLFTCLISVYKKLNSKYKILPVIYLYKKEDYEIFEKLIN